MERQKRLFVAALLIAVLLFNIVAFIPTESHSTLFWPAYAFTMAAFLLQILFVWLAFSCADTMREAFLGIPIVYAGLGYLCIQLVLGIPALYITFAGTRLYVTVCAILLCAYSLIIVLAMIGREAIQATRDAIKARTDFMKSLVRNIEVLKDGIEDSDLKKAIANLDDTARYSDPVSHPEAFGIETQISQQFDLLSQSVSGHDCAGAESCCRVLEQLLAERQKTIASLK